uniref:Ankyrin repeat and SOCS box containing 9 n=2 Tax=Latimeria chalumnae TaxID=7897 RepID=H3AGD7_LATCH
SEDKSAGRSQAAGASSYGDYITNSLMSDSISDWSPVHDAAIHGRLLTLRRLISQGTSVNLLTADQVSPLHEACLGGHAACAKLLVENGAKVNRVAVDWNTPLFNACRSGSAACVNLLLQHGARPQTEYELASPIHEAAKGGHTECVQSLASHGADIDLNIKHLGTPLYVACANQRLECVKKLLESGVNINIGKVLDSPLHAAAKNSNLDVVHLLLDYGADVQCRNSEGQRPVDLAPPTSTVAKVLLEREGVPSLMQLCRVYIRKHLGRKRLHEVSGMQIPDDLKHFLLYR